MPRFRSPDSAATIDRPSIETPLNVPRSTFHASTACLPTVSASLPMMQPPVKTSAVRASTYAPFTVPLPPATRGATAKPISAATTNARFIYETSLGLYAHRGRLQPDLRGRPCTERKVARNHRGERIASREAPAAVASAGRHERRSRGWGPASKQRGGGGGAPPQIRKGCVFLWPRRLVLWGLA